MQANELQRARDALYSISPDCDRATWVKAGMAAHAAGLIFEDFNQWSQAGVSYNAQACKATWRSFKDKVGGIGTGSLFAVAKEHGYGGGIASQKPARPISPRRTTTKPTEAQMLFSRFVPVTAEHPYVQVKKATAAPLCCLRVVPAGDPQRVMGESMAGALVVPVLRPDGTITSLQFITVGETAQSLKAKDKPTKLNLPGASIDGWFTVGDMVTGGMVFLCEGIGTAWAAWMATGNAAVVCFGAGNMERVAKALRQQDSAARLVLCPDAGQEAKAQSIAAAVGGSVAAMPEDWPDNSDLNDLVGPAKLLQPA